MKGYKPTLFSSISMPEEARREGIHIRISQREDASTFVDKYTHQRMHWHDHVHVWYTLSGEYSNEVFGRENWLHEGGLVIIPPFIPHATGGREGQPVTVACIDVSVDFIKHIVPPDKQHIFLNPVPQDYVAGDLHLTGKDLEYVSSFCRKFHRECQKGYHRTMVLHQDEVRDFFIFMSNTVTDRNYYPNDDHERAVIMQAINYINTHFREQLKLSDMCRVTALSRAAFCKLFKKHTGNTFSEFLSTVRIGHAASRICNTDLPIHQIMMESGFHTKSNFTHHFKSLYNCSPRELRKSYPQQMISTGQYYP